MRWKRELGVAKTKRMIRVWSSHDPVVKKVVKKEATFSLSLPTPGSFPMQGHSARKKKKSSRLEWLKYLNLNEIIP